MNIPKIRLIPNHETDEKKWTFGYKRNKIAETIHFLSVKPEEVSVDNYPNCDDCIKNSILYSNW